jgi:uncharacterized protein (DUF433 family)
MSITPTTDPVPLQTDDDGVVRVGDTRITLDTLVTAFRDGATAEEIVQQYPSLVLADVYQVLGYYLKHSVELEAYLSRRQAQSKTVRRDNESRFDPHGVRDRLLARRGDGG